MSKKNYVLDTNILLESPNAIFGFDDNNIIITGTTLQELDSKKTAPGELGYNARESYRILEGLRKNAKLGDSFFDLGNGGMLQVYTNGVDETNLPKGYSLNNPDNKIISSIITLSNKKPKKYILVTNDISMRFNAFACGVMVEEYKNDHVTSKELYTGRRETEVSSSIIDKLYSNQYVPAEDLVTTDLVENEFVTLKCNKQSALAICQKGKLNLIKEQSLFNVTPKNAAQSFALYALTAPVEEIPFVILKGPAGTAKTFLSLAAGLDKTYNSKKERTYDKLLISRNNITSDNDFGYLPGELDNKMGPLLAPFYDNLESLLRGRNTKEDNRQIQTQINDLFLSKSIIEYPLAYMRGRSITNSYLIVDEAQNSTRTQMRDIITRAGKGTKIIICGDPEQIDNHTLDKWNNGLVYASEKMKGSSLCAQITFFDKECVRSPLAVEALKKLV